MMVQAPLIFFALFVFPTAFMIWQVATIDPDNGERSLRLFKSNHFLGIALTAAFVASTLG